MRAAAKTTVRRSGLEIGTIIPYPCCLSEDGLAQKYDWAPGGDK